MTKRHRALLALLLSTLSISSLVLGSEPPGLMEAVHAVTGKTSSFTYALVDLNDDGMPDAVVLLTGRDWCGSGGCTMLILKGMRNGFTLLSKATISNQPIKVLPDREHGWHTLLVSVKGGGIQPGGLVLMRFNGTKFPLNPSVQPRATQEQISSATTLVFQQGTTP